MRRFLIILIVLLIPIAGVPALSYQPGISVTTGIRGSHLIDDYLRTSTLVTLELELPTVTFSNGCRVSVPIGLTANSRTPEHEGLALHGYIEGYLGLGLDQMITSSFCMGTSFRGIYRYYSEIESCLFGGSIVLDLIFSPKGNIGIMIPVEMSFLKGELDYTVSVGSRFLFGGER